MLLILLSCAWIFGIFLGSLLRFSPTLMLSGLLPLGLLFFFKSHRSRLVITSLLLFTFFGGAWYYRSTLPEVNENSLRYFNDTGKVEIRGMISRPPERGDKASQLHLSADRIRVNDEWQTVSGSVLIFTPLYSGYRYGDVLQVSGKLEAPQPLGDFDYPGYLAHQGIYSTMLYPQLEVLERDKGNKVLAWIYDAREHLAQSLEQALPEPQASLAEGILLGMRGNIPQSVRNDFTASGTAHVLAISGQNLSIIAGMLVSLGAWLFGRRRGIYVWLALSVIWIYTLLTGMNPPVVRASIMATMFLMAELLGRQRSGLVALCFAAAVMVGITPRVLWDAAFQMSFAAMAGLILIAPLIQALGKNLVSSKLKEGSGLLSPANFVSDSFSISIGATLAVAPLLAYYFGLVSLVGPIATVLALPALPFIIVLCFLSALAGIVFLPLGIAVGWLAWLALSYLLLLAKGFAALPFASVETELNVALLWWYYALLALALCWVHRPRQSKNLVQSMGKAAGSVPVVWFKWAIPTLLALAILASLAALTMPDTRLRVSFLDVGQGDAILLQQGSQQVLIDGGPSTQTITAVLGRRMPFWDRTIELSILSA